MACGLYAVVHALTIIRSVTDPWRALRKVSSILATIDEETATADRTPGNPFLYGMTAARMNGLIKRLPEVYKVKQRRLYERGPKSIDKFFSELDKSLNEKNCAVTLYLKYEECYERYLWHWIAVHKATPKQLKFTDSYYDRSQINLAESTIYNKGELDGNRFMFQPSGTFLLSSPD